MKSLLQVLNDMFPLFVSVGLLASLFFGLCWIYDSQEIDQFQYGYVRSMIIQHPELAPLVFKLAPAGKMTQRDYQTLRNEEMDIERIQAKTTLFQEAHKVLSN